MAAARHPPSGALCCDRLLFARDSAAAADAAARERTRPLLRQAAASSTSGLPVHAKNGNLPSWWLLLATSLCVPIQITFGMLGIVLVPADIARIVGDESKARYLGITVTLMMIVQVCQPIFGSISDKTRSRFGRRRPYIILGQLTSATALVIMRSSTTFWPYCWGYQLYQVGNCIVFATWCAIQPALHERQRGQFGGYIKLCMGVGFLGAALLGFADGKRYLNHDQTWGILIVLQLPLMLAGIASFSATPGEQPIPDKTINWYTLPIKLSTECMVSIAGFWQPELDAPSPEDEARRLQLAAAAAATSLGTRANAALEDIIAPFRKPMFRWIFVYYIVWGASFTISNNFLQYYLSDVIVTFDLHLGWGR
jgi:Na+/melibiose symporter-like transporter